MNYQSKPAALVCVARRLALEFVQPITEDQQRFAAWLTSISPTCGKPFLCLQFDKFTLAFAINILKEQGAE